MPAARRLGRPDRLALALNVTSNAIRRAPRPPLRWLIAGVSIGVLAGWLVLMARAALRRRRDEPWREPSTGESAIGGRIEFVDIDRPDSRGAPARRHPRSDR